MPECSVVREQMTFLLTETLEPVQREDAHVHIEGCAECSAEWEAYRTTWSVLGDLPELEVSPKMRARFMEHAGLDDRKAQIIPFHRRPATRWMAQAAAVAVLVGGSYFAGREQAPDAPLQQAAVAAPSFRIAESSVVQASDINPDFEGRPDIENVHFFQTGEKADEVGVSFDVKSRVTVKGAPTDRNMVKLLSHFLQASESTTSRSSAIQWVSDQYAQNGSTDPELVKALASLLKNDSHEGVRIKAVDALKALPSTSAPEVRNALVDALKNDPNPAVRIKAVEALANLARSGNGVDATMLNTLREKASQNDENAYVRVKAAEALSQLNL